MNDTEHQEMTAQVMLAYAALTVAVAALVVVLLGVRL